MTEYELGVYTGAFGTLLVIFGILFIVFGWEFKKTYWNKSLSVNNWQINRQNRYVLDGKGDEDQWIRSRSWREK